MDAALSGDDEADGAAALTSDTAAGTALDLGSLGDGHFNADCPTCRSNWNLLNGLSSSAVVADTLLKVPVGPNTNRYIFHFWMHYVYLGAPNNW